MKPLPKATQKLFARWGSKGGKKRKRALASARRTAIASQAARVRWGKGPSAPLLKSVRLENPSWQDPVYLEEILAEGGLLEWRELYHRIALHPFGETAQALGQVVHSIEIYGATNLWRSLLINLQGGQP